MKIVPHEPNEVSKTVGLSGDRDTIFTVVHILYIHAAKTSKIVQNMIKIKKSPICKGAC